MRRLSISVIAVTSAVAFIQIASAADLPRKAPAPPPPAPVYSWTGCYIGIHGGYGWGKNKNDFGNAVLLGDIGPDFEPEFGSYDHNTHGGVFGGQLGCNYQVTSNWVIGVEGEGWWSGMKGSVTTPEDEQEGGSTNNYTQFESKNRWDADIAARFGWTWSQAMLYGKVGAAWGGFRYIETHDDFPHHACGPCSVTFDETRTGLLLGVGFEYAFAPRWSAKIEYDYINFGTHTLPYPSLNPGPFSFDVKDTKNIVKAGINYRFY